MTHAAKKTQAAFGAVAVTACALLALAAPAAPAETYSNGYQLSKFKVEIKGVQTMVQQHTHAAENECDISDFSSGSEKVTFKTAKPIYVIASHMKGATNSEFFSTRQLAIPTRAVVKRSYTSRISSPLVVCEDNGGGVETQFQPDCGTKVVQPFKVQLQYSERKKNGLLLTSYDGEDPFERCSAGGYYMSFPNLLVEGTGTGKFIYAELSQDELFDPQFQKWISIADGSRKEQSAESWTKTHIHWEVSFTRLKTKVTVPK
jgi:hypothetical protein